MNDKQKLERLFSVNENYVELVDLHKDIRDCIQNNHSEGLDDMLKKAVGLSEKASVELRSYAIESVATKPFTAAINDICIEENGVKAMVESDGVVKIKIPAILPFKKIKEIKRSPIILELVERGFYDLDSVIERANAIIKPLSIVLERLKSEGKLERFSYQKCTVEYKSFFSKTRKQGLPDPDNFEYKQITDTIMEAHEHGNDNGISVILRPCEPKKLTIPYTTITVYPDTYFVDFRKNNGNF